MKFRHLLIKRLTVGIICLSIIISSAAFAMTALAASVENNGEGNKKTSIIFSPQGGGRIEYTIGTRTSIAFSRYVNTATAIGQKVTLKASENNATETFLYWYNSYTDRIISYEKTLKFTLSSKTQYYAVFSTPLEGYHYVVYLNYAGSVLYSSDVALNEVVMPPTDVSLPGFSFNGWDHTINEVTAATGTVIVRPSYTLNDSDYTVTFTNTENVSGAGTYNNFDTVRISADAVNGTGQAFSCWKDSENNVVSYDRDYTFRINYNATFTAVYGETVTPEPVIRITNIVEDTVCDKVTFYAERSVPEGYTLVQHGILISTSSTGMLLSAAAMGDAALVKKGTGISNEPCGTYSLAKSEAVTGTVYYGRAFMICENSQGTQIIYYGEIESGVTA